MNRILGLLVVVSLFCLATECQAQRRAGLFNRIVHGPNGSHAGHHVVSGTPEYFHQPQQYSYGHQSLAAEAAHNYNEWRDSNFHDVSQPYPKYYGAFHYSHFSKIGVPHGDLGFRGNGIYWGPWQ